MLVNSGSHIGLELKWNNDKLDIQCTYICICWLQLGADEQNCSSLAATIFQETKASEKYDEYSGMSLDDEDKIYEDDIYDDMIAYDVMRMISKEERWGDEGKTFVRTSEVPETVKENCR